VIGRLIADRYQIEDELGAGGMGNVYRGLDTHTQQTVAIKQLKSEISQSEMIERFKREGEALRELNHPNIVKRLNNFEYDGHHYLVMEYVAGGDLKDLLQQEIKLDYNWCVNIAIDIADALTRAHRLDIIHRDLKPANVLITEDGTPRLTDFGIAHIVNKDRITDSNAIIGTLDYLPPEAFDGEIVDTRDDIWSFGVMLFEILVGTRPFIGANLTNLIGNIMIQPTPDLEQLCPNVPIELIDLIYRMLEKDKSARIRSVRQVGLELEDILYQRASEPIMTRFQDLRSDRVVLSRAKHNLPAQTTSFVGRENDLDALMKLLNDRDIRFTTIVAPGGMGKTRLAIELAQQIVGKLETNSSTEVMFQDGIYFVDLAPLSEQGEIVIALAEAISYQLKPDEHHTPLQQILEFLSTKTMLLVMDNYEHLLSSASLVTDILKAGPNIQVLCTSRQRLNQTDETIYTLSGMDFPNPNTVEEALNYASVQLFVQGAKRANPRFDLINENMQTVAQICHLMQGMPLGILLLSSWLSMLTIDEISQELQQGIDILESDMADLPARHRSVRAVFDYSWQMMNPIEQKVFMHLSIFRGGFTRHSAEQVASARLPILLSLNNKSLIRRDPNNGRFSIHELLRQYAVEKLIAAGQAESAYATHARYFADMMDEHWVTLRGYRQHIALHDIEMDMDNVRTAWHYWAKQRDPHRIKQFLHSLWTVHDIHGWYQAVVDLFVEGCEAIQAIENEEAQAARGWMLTALGLSTTLANLGYEHAANFLATDIWVNRAEAGFGTSHEDAFIANQRGSQIVTEGMQILKQLNSHRDMMIVPLISTAMIAIWSEDHDSAKEAITLCLNIAEEIDHQWGIARAIQLLAVFAMRDKDYQSAEGLALDSLAIFEQSNDNWSTSVLCIEVLAPLALSLRQFDVADNWVQKGLNVAKKVGFRYSIQAAYWQLGYAAALQEDYLKAGRFWSTALIAREQGVSASSVFGSGNQSNYSDPHDHDHHHH
jgi:serine/threonine protein kinase